ncbi:MAG: fimbrillin family protein [Muribaculaceae bacterium]|nr:fimbrillin family protein [Muribaculaceae bacterium]
MKHNILHNILPKLIGLMFLYSCTSDPEVPDYTTGEEMIFDVATASVTRASVITSLSNKSFKLFGDLNTAKVYINGEYFEGIRRIFDGTEVKYTGSTCNYGTTQYWLMGQEYWFVALFPYSPQGVSDMTYDDSKLSFTYTLPSDLNNAVDLLAATDRRKFHLGLTNTTVSLKFNHLLSQINIQAALDEDLMYEDDDEYEASDPDYEDEFIEFHRVDIYGSKTAATFTVAPAATLSTNPATTGTVDTKLIDNGADSKLSKTFTTAKKLTNNKQLVTFFSNTDALLIIPQQFASDSEAKMVLTYTINGNTERERQIELPLAGYNWEAGKTYTYKFTVSKAYTGQIKEGSLTIEIDDFTNPGAQDQWISDDETMKFEFDAPR